MTKLKMIAEPFTRNNRKVVLCRCKCGKEVVVRYSRLVKDRRPRTCGCELGSKGQWQVKGSSYNSWKSMKARCYNKNHPQYYLWGGRGIKVCKRWRKSFAAFLEDMGERPPNTTIDRYPDNRGNYKKSNCRWATPYEQTHNRRTPD